MDNSLEPALKKDFFELAGRFDKMHDCQMKTIGDNRLHFETLTNNLGSLRSDVTLIDIKLNQLTESNHKAMIETREFREIFSKQMEEDLAFKKDMLPILKGKRFFDSLRDFLKWISGFSSLVFLWYLFVHYLSK